MKSRGFTLIELMIVVAIIGILAAVAYPSYQSQMQKSRRTDAHGTLLNIQHAQEKLRASCATYGSALAAANDCTASPVEVQGPANSPEGWYAIAISNVSATSYTLTASTVAGEAQAGDTDCAAIVLTVSAASPAGAKTSLDANGNASSNCW